MKSKTHHHKKVRRLKVETIIFGVLLLTLLFSLHFYLGSENSSTPQQLSQGFFSLLDNLRGNNYLTGAVIYAAPGDTVSLMVQHCVANDEAETNETDNINTNAKAKPTTNKNLTPLSIIKTVNNLI